MYCKRENYAAGTSKRLFKKDSRTNQVTISKRGDGEAQAIETEYMPNCMAGSDDSFEGASDYRKKPSDQGTSVIDWSSDHR